MIMVPTSLLSLVEGLDRPADADAAIFSSVR
jgi:hypothetical protein